MRGLEVSGITESSTDPVAHQPTRSVMHSVSDSHWVSVVEGALIELDTYELQGRGRQLL